MTSKTPTGRFAPSPTGELHLGSLVAATASYLNVKQQSGYWLLRIDDIDTPRVKIASQDRICRQLEAYGFEWDKLILQSQRHSHYLEALELLKYQQQAYTCQCTRKQIQQRVGKSGLYDQYCRNRQLSISSDVSIRLITPQTNWQWTDLIQGEQSFNWQQETGDFIIRRSDGIWAYHLVAAVDDSDDGITEVIRGADLLGASAPQQYLQQCLKRPSPLYGHHPLILNAQTKIKLSKASNAPAIQAEDTLSNLFQVLVFLNQQPPAQLQHASLAELWHWAITHWSIKKINPSNEGLISRS